MARLEPCEVVPLPIATPAVVLPTASGKAGFDLLRLKPVRLVVLWHGFPYVFQVAMLMVFVALVILGWGLAAPAGVPAKLYAKSSLVTLLIWGLWWPAMVWAAVLLGRAWCMICPLELVSNVGERLGRRLGIRQRPLARWLAAGWMIVALYAAIQMLVTGAGLNRSPHLTAIFLYVLLALSCVTGLFLMHRAFCRGFCPVGLLLGTYGRGGMLAVRAGGTEKCAGCDERYCLRACNRTNLDGRSCPSLLNPPKLNSNRDCLVCGQCIKACRPDNMQLLLRPPFSRHDAREPMASRPVTLFVMLGSGFVLSELCTESPAAHQWFVAAPEWLAHHAGLGGAAGWLEGLWTLVLVPVVMWTILGVLAQRVGNSGGLPETWRRLALPAAVVISAGHMAKGFAKFTGWAGFLPGALSSPDGVATARDIAANSLAAPAALLPMWAVASVGISLVLVALLLAIREARLANGGRRVASAVPLTLVAVLYGGIILGWA